MVDMEIQMRWIVLPRHSLDSSVFDGNLFLFPSVSWLSFTDLNPRIVCTYIILGPRSTGEESAESLSNLGDRINSSWIFVTTTSSFISSNRSAKARLMTPVGCKKRFMYKLDTLKDLIFNYPKTSFLHSCVHCALISQKSLELLIPHPHCPQEELLELEWGAESSFDDLNEPCSSFVSYEAHPFVFHWSGLRRTWW